MLSTIRIALDVEENKPTIKLQHRESDDLRDDVVKMFIDKCMAGKAKGLLIIDADRYSTRLGSTEDKTTVYSISESQDSDILYSMLYGTKENKDRQKIKEFFDWYKTVEKH